jgi:hypothetical protein
MPALWRNLPIRSALGSSFSTDRKPLPLIPPAFGPGSREMLKASASTPPQIGGTYGGWPASCPEPSSSMNRLTAATLPVYRCAHWASR